MLVLAEVPTVARVTVLLGDALTLAAEIPAGYAQMILTSPPYYGQRAYSDDPDEIGREPSLADYVEHLVKTFAALRSVLADDGTLWLNLGDKFRRKQLLGVPWRVAFGLQDDGWRLRSEIIWEKPNAKPSAVRDRPTYSHEQLFLFSKNRNYYYDVDAVREPHVTFTAESKMSKGRSHFGKVGGTPEQGKYSGDRNLHQARWDQAFHPLGRNRRTVWSIPTSQCKEAHFAVMPERLAEPCVLAGSRAGDVVLDPFMGAGTTGMVAKRLGRRSLGLELVPEYVDLAERRIAAVKEHATEKA